MLPCLLALFLLEPCASYAQDDAPWWRQLFKPSASAPGEPDESPAHEQPMDVNGVEGAFPDSVVQAAPTDKNDDIPLEGPRFDLPAGTVAWGIPDAIAGLDSLVVAPEELRIPGFRVQLFMGRLDSARSLRRALEEDPLPGMAVHLSPYPPLFGVQVGDFRTPLAAHRAKGLLIRRFPDALVVPAELSPEAAFPVSGDCTRTP